MDVNAVQSVLAPADMTIPISTTAESKNSVAGTVSATDASKGLKEEITAPKQTIRATSK